MDLYERADREIELIENDDSLTDEEKQREIREIIREYHQLRREENEDE